MNVALIFAGGVGSRMGLKTPKQFLKINGVPIIVLTLMNFQNHKDIDGICVVTLKEYKLDKVVSVVSGGKTGQDSIYNGLCEINKKYAKDTTVLIHDGVRPIITDKVISDNIEAVKKYGNAITCKQCIETIITIKNQTQVDEVIDRANSLTAQAPQSFILREILEAHENMRKDNPNYDGVIDSCTLMRLNGKELHTIMGNVDNLKVTTKNDYLSVKAIVENQDIECE